MIPISWSMVAKFSSQRRFAQLNAKNNWKAPRLSSLAIISCLTFFKYFGVFFMLSRLVYPSSNSYITFWFPWFTFLIHHELSLWNYTVLVSYNQNKSILLLNILFSFIIINFNIFYILWEKIWNNCYWYKNVFFRKGKSLRSSYKQQNYS